MILRIGFWFVVLLAAVFVAHWGAERLTEPLKKLRRQWGITAIAGGTLIGLASASPEVGTNTISAIQGVSGIGLGNMLGANIISVPLMVTVAYVATRKRNLSDDTSESGQSSTGDSATTHQNHEQHRHERLLQVDQSAVTVLALPYLGIITLVAILTIPEPWRGLQPVDGAIMFLAYLLYAGQALVRGRQEGESVEWSAKEIGFAVAGLGALAVGAYFTVRATENLASLFGISNVIAGLFITATMSTTPEVFATWAVTRSGQVTSGATGVLTDNAVTMTLAFVPLALVTVTITDFQLYWVNLVFVAVMPIIYSAFLYWSRDESGFSRWQVLVFILVYLGYVGVMLFGVLNIW
ncbi:sodium:calcium antiporter [Halogranum rubrum]|uniref:Sodium/calcium exchanger membrane region domain-containing protein n=1 Tax=Halogranum salarium B-1 TaxID=1210908 RepID=J3JCR3_9EURY|nr:hypothetical protein [Halogranum salarium]EJN56841.1 hypothetical protein HSB1_46580 [Halogranum salarium B-1]